MGGDPSIYIQKVDGSGTVVWPSPSNPPNETGIGGMVPDYAGGAFTMAGHGSVPAPISCTYRLSGGGSCTSVFSAEAGYSPPDIIPCGSGGAIVAWTRNLDDEMNMIWQTYVQKVDSDNSILWDPGGVPVCSDAIEQRNPRLVTDGSGGAIVAWFDERSGRGIYAQRIDSGGDLLWAVDGVPVCAGTGFEQNHDAVPDGAGGAIIVWQDSRNGTDDIYAQRIDPDGVSLWTTDGVPICSAAGDQGLPSVITDGAGGAIIAWLDGRAGNSDIYAQRIDASGAVLWTADGVPAASGAGDQECHQIAEDGCGGAIVAWIHNPDGTSDIMAQKIDGSGSPAWPSGGVPVCTIGVDVTKIVMAGNDDGTAIVAWDDFRTAGMHGEIYAALISDALTDAGDPGQQSAARLYQNYPNPFNPTAEIRFSLSASGTVTLEIYDVAGRLVTRLLDGAHLVQGPHRVAWNGRSASGELAASGIYFYRLETEDVALTRKMVLLR